jgi:uncharacterized protein YcnI
MRFGSRSGRASAVLLTLTLAAASAEAHMSLLPRSATAGTPVKLDFRAFHGCQDRPTISVTVKIPDGFLLPAPQVKPGWQLSTKSAPYASNFQIGDRVVTEGFSEITWSGGSLPADYMDDFSIAGMMPQRPGEKLVFPVTQGCLAADGKGTEYRETALNIKLEPQPEEAGGKAPAASSPEDKDGASAATGEGDAAAPSAGPSAGLILAGLALVLSVVALLRSRRW